MAEDFDDPFENPMYCGRFSGLDIYITGGEEGDDPALIHTDPTGLNPTYSPVPLIEAMFDAELKRHIRKAEQRENRKEPEETPEGDLGLSGV
jgi:hypothetical protein